MSINETGLIKRQTIVELVAEYEAMIQELQGCAVLLQKAQNRMKASFGGHALYGIRGGNIHIDYEDAKFEVDQAVWRYLIELLGIRHTLSVKRAEELDRQLESLKGIPEITVDNVYSTLFALAERSGEFLQEAIQEVSDFLRPDPHWREPYKTNNRWMVGEKVILSGYMSMNYGGKPRVSYYYEKHLLALDKVFYGLDGKPMPENIYRGESIDRINTSPSFAETPYFEYKGYKNGNLHIKFKRTDLVGELNRRMSGTQLKGSER